MVRGSPATLWMRPDTVKMLLRNIACTQTLVTAVKLVNVISEQAKARNISADFQTSGNSSSGMSRPVTYVTQIA